MLLYLSKTDKIKCVNFFGNKKNLLVEMFDIISELTFIMGVNTVDKKYQIFISSTYKDLIEEREQVRDVILSMYHIPIGMEMFNAADEDQWEIIKETIDSSDYYVLIIGKRYGSIIPEGKPDAGMSYTEKEYRYAAMNNIPILTFIKKDSAITVDKMDTNSEKVEKLKKFIDEIIKHREVDMFENTYDLGNKVTLALQKQIRRKKRPGWIRGDQFDIDAIMKEINVLKQSNLKLTTENEKLKELTRTRMPCINVSVQFAGTIDNPIEIDDYEELSNNVTVQRIRVSKKGYLGLAKCISIDDVPDSVKNVVTREMIDDYNSKLPDCKDVEKYDHGMWFYNEVRKNGQLLDFTISNNGTAKATDINITLEFPKTFIILDRTEADNLSKPEKPIMPINPIEDVMMQNYIAEQYGNPVKEIIHLMKDSYTGLNFDQTKPLSANALLNRNHTIDWTVNIDGQRVKIWSRDLIHTYSQIADSLCIIPLEKGSFSIKITMICAEYTHPEKSAIEISVE